MDIVQVARNTAIKAHGDQKYGEHPYVVHLDDVAELVKVFGSTAQVVAYLHDTIEDTKMTAKDIEDAFGTEVMTMVCLLTDPYGKNRREKKAAANKKLAKIRIQDDERLVLAVKAADRLANVRRCVAEKNAGLLAMYKREQYEFHNAVYRRGLNDAMFQEIEKLLE